MKIVICGSSSAKVEKIRLKRELTALGHIPIIHPYYERLVNGELPDLAEQMEKEHHVAKKKYGFIKWYYNAITQSDAILVVNLDKKGIKNYIGGNTLMEIGFAHVHGKKIFLLNPINENLSYSDEIKATYDLVINGDLKKIK